MLVYTRDLSQDDLWKRMKPCSTRRSDLNFHPKHVYDWHVNDS